MLTKQEKLDVAQSAMIDNAISILGECKTPFTSVVADTEHKTVVNAVTLEVEAALIGRFITKLQNYKDGIYEEEH